MGCGQSSTKPAPLGEVQPTAQVGAKEQGPEESLMQETPEGKALKQLKLIFQDMDLDANGAVNKAEFDAALKRNDKLPGLLKQANMNSLEGMAALDTNNDGVITWGEFEAYLKGRMDDLQTKDLQSKDLKTKEQAEEFQAKVEETAEVSAKELAQRKLKIVFEHLQPDESGKVNQKQLADALKKENGLVELLQKAEFKHDIDALCQFDTDKDGFVSWDEFVTKLEDTAKEEIKCTGELAAAVEVQIDDKPEEKATKCGFLFC